MSCTCVPCRECEGTGHVFFAFDGTYLRKNRCDDLDEMEVCEACGGCGIGETCDYCRELMEEDMQSESD